jgi:hypothetical protein
VPCCGAFLVFKKKKLLDPLTGKAQIVKKGTLSAQGHLNI